MYKIAYTKEARERIGKLSAKFKLQIKRAIERIAENPDTGKCLMQELSGILSYRTGKFRIIYRVFHGEILVLILTLGYRKDIYKKISRKLS
ncbi:MAG: type II toxin-antitoxin system RelE/ParE family toxin [Candidatus Omnitrophota bacterium]